MTNENIILADDKNLNKTLKPSQKRKITSKLPKKSIRSENKIAKSEVIENPVESMQFETFELERTSTPNHINLCEHCKHSHARECCLYVYDDYSDIMKYSLFKQSVEEPYYVVDNDENFHMKIGHTTPKNFPAFTERNSTVADMKMHSNVKQPPIVYLRQYVWPIYMPQYPHILNDQYFYNPHNFIYYPPVNLPNHMPPVPYLATSCAPIPHEINTNVDYRHYYNPQYVETKNFVPMNYNYIW